MGLHKPKYRVNDDGSISPIRPDAEGADTAPAPQPHPKRGTGVRPDDTPRQPQAHARIPEFVETHKEPVLAPDDLRYSDEEWMVPSQDRRGHSATVAVRLPPVMIRAIEVLVQSKQFQYKTVDDFVRHAVYRHLFFAHKVRPGVRRNILVQFEAMVEQCRDEYNQEMIKSALENLSARCKEFSTDKCDHEATRLVVQAKALLDSIDDKSAWKKKFMADWKELAIKYAPRPRIAVCELQPPARLASLPKLLEPEY